MAVAEMKKMTLLGLEREKKQILSALVSTQNVEITDCAEIELCAAGTSGDFDVLTDSIRRLNNALSIISDTVYEYNNSVKKKDKKELPKAPFTAPRKAMTFEEFEKIEFSLDEAFEKAEYIERIRAELVAERNYSMLTASEIAKLSEYGELDYVIKDFTDTRNTYRAVGTVSRENYSDFQKIADECELCVTRKIGTVSDGVIVEIVCHKSEKKFWDELIRCGFQRSTVDTDLLPAQEVEKLQLSLELSKEKEQKLLDALLCEIPCVERLRITGDYLELKAKEAEADKGFMKTRSTFVLQSFVPSDKADAVTSSVNEATADVMILFDDIKEDEFAPTLNRNNKFVSSFETVTNMYTPQNYHEPDPNSVMSVFYFLIFGLMTADIGYGLLLTIGGLLIAKLIKQNTGIKQLARLFGICGFSTVLWGIIFGSFFCMDVSVFIPNCPDWYPLLPSPMNFPIVTMIISILLGILHIMAGIALNANKLAKRKDTAGVLFDACVWEIFFVGIILLALKPACDMIIQNSLLGTPNAVKQPQILALQYVPDLTNVGLYVILASLVLVLLTGGHNKKGFFGKVIGGFGGVYGVINYFSDVISYVRIFGLMLSSAMFGLVVNQIAEMLMGNVIGYIFAVILLLLLHAFNLALSVLGVYVHNGRLQYVEFFGKFYEGEGRLFTPLGSDLKHVTIK